ncbi:hypothetical protein K0M31_016201 [Melipona bicolor]|uniref:Uncharacterized protein n=1 Tax=Melipona bicolor TaxID=60889 RepID=A0AA40G7B6_9HYME|nr:hypothetical protein K0M31_016201 [Melipona bicolor]
MGESRRMSARRNKNTKKVELNDLIKREKEQYTKMNSEFNWQDLFKYILKCVLYRVDELHQIVVKGLRQCSHEVVDQFLMITFELDRENATRQVDNRLIGDIKMADNLFGLKFEYKSAGVSDSEKLHIMPVENIIQIVHNSSLKYRNEEMLLTIRTKFDKAEYEEKLNEYYEKYSPIISRRAFENTTIDKLRSKNSESELTDFLGVKTMKLSKIENVL